MNTEQERADFEAWYEWEYSEAMPCGYSPHGYYLDARIQLLFRCWQARAALQSQDREDAERYRTAFDLLKILFEAWENGPACYNNGDRDEYIGNALLLDNKTFHACVKVLSIDHARRIEENK